MRDFVAIGTRDSDPIASSRDQRAFCFLESARLVTQDERRITTGWYELSDNVRWTYKRFAFTVQFPGEAGVGEVVLRFMVPELLVALRPEVTVQAFVNKVALGAQT